nr:ribonuclease H-like domain-containing protein [Tanacetum cinerariifolium]
MALPEDHLAKFHKMADAKEMWQGIKSRFGSNDESKKMQKYLLKQKFEGVSHEDANQKFLRSLPSSWSQVALIMRTNPGLDTLCFDDLYNNLRVFERDVKGITASSSSNTQNVMFVSVENTSSTNDVSTAYNVSSPYVLKSQKEGSSSYTDEVIHSFFANQSSAPQLDYDDLEQINDDDMDLKWQMAIFSIRIKKFHKKTGRKLAKGNQDNRRRDAGYNGNKTRDNDAQNYAMMAYSSSNLGSNNETLVDESDYKPSEHASCESKSSVETSTSMPKPVVNEPKAVSEPKAWSDAPIIEQYESDSDDEHDAPHRALKDKGIVDSGCSRYMTGNKAHLADYQEFKGSFVAFGGSNGRITGKGKIKIGRLDFKDVYYVKELMHYNLFSVSQMCDKENKVLFNDTDCLVLSPDFKLLDEHQVLLKIPRQHNMYSFNLKNIDPSRDLACLFAKASINESKKWHRRLSHVIFKNLNKLVKENLVRGLPSKIFENDHTCVAYQKGKQHKASCSKEAKNSAGTQANDDQGTNSKEINLNEEHFILPIWSAYLTTVKSSRDKIEKNTSFKTCEKPEATHDIQNASTSSTNLINTASTPLSATGPSRAFNDGKLSYPNPSKYALPDDPSMPYLEDIYDSPNEGVFTNSSYDDEDLPFGKKTIRTKWVYRNKKDERGVVVRNKARSVAQGHRQEEGIDYDEVFASMARIKAIRIFLDFASYMGFIVYQMDMKSAFMYGTIDEEVYVSQPPGFVDPKFPNKVYKVVKALYGLHQAPKACVKTASTPIETQKPLVKDEEAADVDVYLYRSIIGSLMYLTAFRPDVMFAVYACSRHHFIRDAYKKKLIQVLKIHTDDNVADLLTKAFDVSSKELASPKQTALGKDISDLLMAGRLPKTTLPTSHGLYKDMDPHEFTHV